MYLYGPKRVEVGQSLSPELLRGLQYLDDVFSITAADGDQDFYYYMWTIQNVGQATGYRTFNGVDWFREVDRQAAEHAAAGRPVDRAKGAHVSTSLALLYLARARGPLAICKLRFDPIVYVPSKTNKPAPDPKKKPATLSRASRPRPTRGTTGRTISTTSPPMSRNSLKCRPTGRSPISISRSMS